MQNNYKETQKDHKVTQNNYKVTENNFKETQHNYKETQKTSKLPKATKKWHKTTKKRLKTTERYKMIRERFKMTMERWDHHLLSFCVPFTPRVFLLSQRAGGSLKCRCPGAYVFNNPSMVPGNVCSVLFETVFNVECCKLRWQEILGKSGLFMFTF